MCAERLWRMMCTRARSDARWLWVCVLLCGHCGRGGDICQQRVGGCAQPCKRKGMKNSPFTPRGWRSPGTPTGRRPTVTLGGVRRASDCATTGGASAASPRRHPQAGGGHAGRRAPSPAPGPCARRAPPSGSSISPGSNARCTTAQRFIGGAVQNYPKPAFTRRLISCTLHSSRIKIQHIMNVTESHRLTPREGGDVAWSKGGN